MRVFRRRTRIASMAGSEIIVAAGSGAHIKKSSRESYVDSTRRVAYARRRAASSQSGLKQHFVLYYAMKHDARHRFSRAIMLMAKSVLHRQNTTCRRCVSASADFHHHLAPSKCAGHQHRRQAGRNQ